MQPNPSYRWYILVLTALTSAFVIGAPAMCLAVLFPAISADLHLSLVQMGVLWSIGSLPAIFTSPISGALDDRFGPKRVMLAGAFLTACAAGLRGFANSYTSMLLVIILIGILLPLVTSSAYKICGLWFPPQQLGLANGVLAMGLGLGFLCGSLLSANVLLPWLGGWRQVIFFYAGVAALFCIPWYLAQRGPEPPRLGAPVPLAVPMRKALGHVARLKNIWLLGLTLLGASGCIQGVLGYLSLYLRGAGWSPASADGALSLINALGFLFILPITLWSDRLGSRKALMAGLLLVVAAGAGMLSVGAGALVWAAVVLLGLSKDAVVALLMTMAIETDRVGAAFAGTASGFMMFFMFTGNLLAPPLGNKLADLGPALPFAFWGGLTALGLVSLLFARRAAALLTK
jgi:predicted MFS family arabinose efflux permease